jgi:uncharacterized protein
MVGILEPGEIEELLSGNVVGRLGCHANGRTYVVPMSYAYEDGCVYGHAQEGLKIDMMRQNPEVCFEVDRLKEMSNWKSVIAWGNFEEIKDTEERNKALQILVKRKVPSLVSDTLKLSDDWPFNTKQLEDISGIVFKICLEEKTGRFELASTNSVSYKT